MQSMTEEQFKAKHGATTLAKLDSLDEARFGAVGKTPTNKRPMIDRFTEVMGLGGATDVFGRLMNRSGIGNLIQTDAQRESAQINAELTGQPVMSQQEINQMGVEAPTGKEIAGAVLQTGATAISPAIAPIGVVPAMVAGAGVGFSREVGQNLMDEKQGMEILQPGAETVAGALIPPALKAFSGVARTVLAPSFDVLANSIKKNTPVVKETFEQAPSKLRGLLKNVRFGLSDIDSQVETALKRSNTDEVNKYFQQAKNAATDTRKPTPLELAGSKAEEAHDVIGEAIKKAGEGKRTILNQVADNRVSGNVVNDTMSEGIQKMGEKYGIKIAADGTIETAKGRVAKLDDTDARLVSEYFNKLNKLGVNPTVRQIDDFVDWSQSQLYKQSKSLSTLDAADRAVVADLKQITGSLNGRLKNEVGNGYAEVNARMSELLDMQDELSKALGADARKGGGLMKRLFSPFGGQTRSMFDQIYRETGIDLDKEANLARFAMDSVGDVRQKSLLKQIDAGFESASEIDFTKPMSIIRFIRERADLDGQELANEIIRRSQSGQ
jgi:hypothetical protein